jgi:hypothetical protein
MQLGITAKERLGVDGYLEMAELVSWYGKADLVETPTREFCEGGILCIFTSHLLCLMLVSCLAYSATLKKEATCSPKTSVDFQWTTWHYIPADRTLQILVELQFWILPRE